MLSVAHQLQGATFVGSALIVSALEAFFSSSYAPRPAYRAQAVVVQLRGNAEPSQVEQLAGEGFRHSAARQALIRCDGDVRRAREFLKTGGMFRTEPLPVDYRSCPLFFLVLEVVECFMDLPNHCCMCRAPMPAGFKPICCGRALCQMQVINLGIGSSVVEELKRDPQAADFVISAFCSALDSGHADVLPPEQWNLKEVAGEWRSIQEMTVASDSRLGALIGDRALRLLRWVLMGNRAHLIALEGGLRLRGYELCKQFLSVTATPEREAIFEQLRARHGSRWLWHGSPGMNWHSILRSGLKNMSNTARMSTGAAYGAGIYLAANSGLSWGYSRPVANRYGHSGFGESFNVIALCEVAKVGSGDGNVETVLVDGRPTALKGFLKEHGTGICTCTLEEAVIVRFLFVGEGGSTFRQSVPDAKEIPRLRQVLEYMASKRR